MKQHLERSNLNGIAFLGMMTKYNCGTIRLHLLLHRPLPLIEPLSNTFFDKRGELRSLQLAGDCVSFDQSFSFDKDDIFVDRNSRG